MVNDSKNLKDKIFAYKGLGMIGSADIIGAVISAIFWLSIASVLEVEEYGELHYFIGIAGVVFVVALIGTRQAITVYSAKKVNVVSTLFLISLLVGTVIAISVFFISNKIDVSLLLIAFIINEMSLGYLLGNYSLVIQNIF